MSETNTSADEPFFRALLTPHRSLGRTGFAVLMLALVSAWLIGGAFMLARGAWPVVGFLGLDVLLVYIAFRLNYRAARAREEVAISRSRLDIRKVAPSGRREEHVFNPLWTRFSVGRHAMIGITRMDVIGQGRNVAVGSFLNPDDRESFAKAFAGALAKAKSR